MNKVREMFKFFMRGAQFIKKWVQLCSNKSLFTKTGGGLDVAYGPQLALGSQEWIYNLNGDKRNGMYLSGCE